MSKTTKNICLYRNHKFLKSFFIDRDGVHLDRYDPLPYIFQAVDFDDLKSKLYDVEKYFRINNMHTEFYEWYGKVCNSYFDNPASYTMVGLEALFKDKEFRKSINREVYKDLLK